MTMTLLFFGTYLTITKLRTKIDISLKNIDFSAGFGSNAIAQTMLIAVPWKHTRGEVS